MRNTPISCLPREGDGLARRAMTVRGITEGKARNVLKPLFWRRFRRAQCDFRRRNHSIDNFYACDIIGISRRKGV